MGSLLLQGVCFICLCIYLIVSLLLVTLYISHFRRAGTLSWEWVLISGIYFFMKHFCITILFFLWWVLLTLWYHSSNKCFDNQYAWYQACSPMLFFCCFLILDYDGLALGSEFVGFCPDICELCKNIWSWPQSSNTQRNMEGMLPAIAW